MKKLILIFLIFFNFLLANDYLFPLGCTSVSDGSIVTQCYYSADSFPSSDLLGSPSYPNCVDKIYNDEILVHYDSNHQIVNSYYLHFDYRSECTSGIGLWFYPYTIFICEPGYSYNYSTEECKPSCDYETLIKLALEKCISLDFVANMSCLNGEYNITCKDCSQVLQLLKDYCAAHDGILPDGNYTCSSAPDTSITINFSSDFNISMCIYPNDNTTDSNVTDSNETNPIDNNITSDDNNISDSADDSNLSSGDTSDSDNNNDSGDTSDNNQSSDNSCPDPCSIYKQIGVQVTSSTVDGYTCFTITYPTYGNCVLKYHTSDNTAAGANCISGCGDSSTTNITNNVTTSTVNVDMSNVEERLDSINQKLEDLKNMTPDSNFSVNGSDPDTDSFISQFGDFFNNIGNDLENIKNSFSQVSGMLKKDNYKLTVFQSDSTTCPISATLFGRKFDVDFCSFILPYRPILSLFFTFVFNFLVIKYFLKLVILKEDK
ncbi:hypothetical protein [Nautilia sp.]